MRRQFTLPGFAQMAKTSTQAIVAAALAGLLLVGSSLAQAADTNPLRPADRSSPRATLAGFVASMDSV